VRILWREVLPANEIGLDEMTVGGQILEQTAQPEEVTFASGVV
jgi:hypothetical protein